MKKYFDMLLNKDNGNITFIASDETLDRGGEVVPLDAWDLANFKKNPVLLVNHDYQVQNIVGKADNIRIENNALLFEPKFHGITQLSREVEAMVSEGILNTVSVGFMPHGPQKDGDRPSNELFEISFVPVPANPSAARLEAVLAKSIDDIVEKDKIAKWLEVKTEEDDVKDKKELPEIKEGRVISNKNRKLISDSITILKQAAAALDELLSLSDTNEEKDGEEKGREPKVLQVRSEKEETPIPSTVVRALQSINRDTNDLLRKFKK